MGCEWFYQKLSLLLGRAMKCCLGLGMAGVILSSSLAAAAEVSLLSGIYRKEEYKSFNDDAGSKSVINLGMRYGDVVDQDLGWFGQGEILIRDYESGDQGASPSDSTSLNLGFGGRLFLDPFTETTVPYLYLMGSFKNDKDASLSGNSFTEVETNGLFYSGAVGVRVGLGAGFFVELETLLFESALFGTVKTEVTTFNGQGEATKTSETETSKFELFVNSVVPFETLVVNVGMEI